MENSKILTKAAKLMTRRKWCHGTLACNADGDGVPPNAADAVKWCLLGAVCKISNLERPSRIPEIMFSYIRDGICAAENMEIEGWAWESTATPATCCDGISAWNDDQATFKLVRATLLEAAEYAKQDEGHELA